MKVNENVLDYLYIKGAQMLWDHLIIIFVTVSLITAMRYLDTMPGYSCPKYCGVDHKHWDWPSDFDQPIDKNVKVNKTKELALK